MQQFPLGPSISQVRGVLKVLNENKGAMTVAKLAEEINEQIDSLLPLLHACELLGMIKVKNGEVSLTDIGNVYDEKSFMESARNGMQNIEPFKTVIDALDKHELTTHELAKALRKRGVSFHADGITNEEILKSLLIGWGIRIGMLHYDSKKDLWRAEPIR
ncbi:MAG: AAA-associated domain-containing protein [Candidatus Micrarchaeia archaeon]